MVREITRRKAIQTLSVGGLTIALSGCQVNIDTEGNGVSIEEDMTDGNGPQTGQRWNQQFQNRPDQSRADSLQ